MGAMTWSDGTLGDERGPGGPVAVLLRGVGDGVFETCSVVGGRPFALTRHLRRLARSASALGFTAPDEDEIRAAIAHVLATGGPDLGRLRVSVFAGPGPLGSDRSVEGTSRPTVSVLVGPAVRPTTVRVARVPWVRNERSAVVGLKTTSYAENVVALADAVRRGADEALLANTRGELCEGTSSNVFVERAGELVTPALASGCLPGITRELMLEWGSEAGLPLREARPGELPVTVLDDVARGAQGTGLAVSSSVRGLVPVSSLDGVDLAVGPISLDARRLFDARCKEDLDP
ncbi:MAG: aminotransferase class IV [Cellulomonas sp.]|nr:aminotransferase class IV [Cellulomonas sp.]